MKIEKSIEELCDELRGAYASRRIHFDQGKVGTANKLYEKSVQILRQIRLQSGQEYAAVLRELLMSSEDDLCGLVAVDGLWEIPREAEASLLRVSKNGGLVSLSAHYALIEWKKGTLVRPTDLA